MTKTEAERLQRMEDNQDHFTNDIKRIFKRLDEQDRVLIRIDKTLNELTGGKKELMWLTGTTIAIAGIAAAFLAAIHTNNK